MTAINFPSSPSVGALHTVGARTWTWDGYIWVLNATTISAGVVGSTELADSSVIASKIATNAITASKLATSPTNTYVLTADSTTSTGTKWAVIPPSGGLSTSTEGAISTMAIGA